MATDKRHEFVESCTTLALRCKPDKWAKLVGSEEGSATLAEFFDKQDVLALVLSLSPAGQLVPCLDFPPALKGKGIYFVKKKRENITRDNCRAGLLVGDLGPSPVEQLIAAVEEVGARRAARGRPAPPEQGAAPARLSPSGCVGAGAGAGPTVCSLLGRLLAVPEGGEPERVAPRGLRGRGEAGPPAEERDVRHGGQDPREDAAPPPRAPGGSGQLLHAAGQVSAGWGPSAPGAAQCRRVPRHAAPRGPLHDRRPDCAGDTCLAAARAG